MIKATPTENLIARSIVVLERIATNGCLIAGPGDRNVCQYCLADADLTDDLPFIRINHHDTCPYPAARALYAEWQIWLEEKS